MVGYAVDMAFYHRGAWRDDQQVLEFQLSKLFDQKTPHDESIPARITLGAR
jgi:hypothetical protein